MTVLKFKSTPKSFSQIAEEIEPLVQKWKKAGPHKATFLCPQHDDKNPSAWIEESENGWVHAHCSVCGNLREHFNNQGIFFSQSRNPNIPIQKRDRSNDYYQTLRSKAPENINRPRRQMEVLYFGEPNSTLTHDVYPVSGQKWEARIQQTRVSKFSTGNHSAENIEKTRNIVLRYLEQERHLTGPFDDLLFALSSLDTQLNDEKKALMVDTVKAVLITPLRNPANYHERGWQETWLNENGHKIGRHFPYQVPQSGRVFYRKQTGAETLIVGEGLESTLSAPDKPEWGKADRIAVMSLSNFKNLQLIKKYKTMVFVPDLETHQKGLQAVLQIATRYLHTADLFLIRPDGKNVLELVTQKMDMNDVDPAERGRLSVLPLNTDTLLPSDHPMRHWQTTPVDALYQEIYDTLDAQCHRAGSGQKKIIAVGTGSGKSHALQQILPHVSENTVIAATPTREGRKNLGSGLLPEQEHHSRAEALPGQEETKDPQRWCQIYYPLIPAESTAHVVLERGEVPAPSVMSDLGFPVSPICNHECPHGLATLHHVTNGEKGEDTGAQPCPHLLNRLERWYQDPQIVSTQAGLNGDPLLMKANGRLRDQVVLDESPQMTQSFIYDQEMLHQLHVSTTYNFKTDQRFYTESDREERLVAYEQTAFWIVHLKNMLNTGWKDGAMPPPPGHDWQEFYDLIEKYKHFSYVTIFERAYSAKADSADPDSDYQKHYGPVLLDRLAQAIQNETVYYGRENRIMTAILPTELGMKLRKKLRKQDITVMTATPSRLLKTLCPELIEKYPATPNLKINWTRGKGFSATALKYHAEDTLRDVTDIIEALPDESVILTTKAYEDKIDPSGFPGKRFGHWYRDHEGQNRWKTAKHMEIIGIQQLTQEQYWIAYESQRKLYNMPWQPARQDDIWEIQKVGISYLPGSENTVYLPKDNPDFAYFIREYHTQEIAQAVGRLRASRRLDETLTVNIRTKMPVLPLYGLFVNTFDGHETKQKIIHERAVQHVLNVVENAMQSGLKITFRQIDDLSKKLTGKGIRFQNWKKAVDSYVNSFSNLAVNTVPIDVETLWQLTSPEQIEAEARRRGDRIRRKEAAMPGRSDGSDGMALIHVVERMNRDHCHSGIAAQAILEENRHHQFDKDYFYMLEKIIMEAIPKCFWTEDGINVA